VSNQPCFCGIFTLSVLALLAVTVSMNAAGQAPPQPVLVDPVRLEKVTDRRLVTGEIRAVRTSKVAARESGLVIRVAVREGQVVKSDAVLAALDDERLKIDLAAMEANSEVARATLEERQALLEQAARDLESLKNLSKRSATNPKELADAGAAHAAARARLQQAECLLKEINMRADLLRLRIKDMVIRAPFAGAVVRKYKDLGEWIGVGEAVLELVSVSDVEAWLDVPQRFYAAVQKNKAAITVRSEAAGRSFEATDFRIVPQVDRRARIFPLVVRIPGAAGVLTPGMSVTAWVPTSRRVNQLTVSRNAVLIGDTGAYLFVARGGSSKEPAQATQVQVKQLFGLGDRVVVQSSGLQSGDLAIVEGNERLFPMMPVIPTPLSASKSKATKKQGAAGAVPNPK